MSTPVFMSTYPVQLFDGAPANAFYAGITGSSASHFAFATDGTVASGSVVAEPPAPFTLDTRHLTSLRDIAVSRDFAPGAAIEFAQGRTGVADPYRLRANPRHGGLFVSDSAWSSPYASVADGGAYGGLRFTLGDMRLRVGVAARDVMPFETGTLIAPLPRDLLASSGAQMSAEAASAGIDWQVTDWAGIAVTATHASEEGSVLGTPFTTPGAGTETDALSISARVGFGDGWVTTVAFDQGVTRMNLKPAFTVPGGTLYSNAYGVALMKEGVFGDDVLGFSVSRPLQSNGLVFDNTAFGPRARLAPSNLTPSDAAPQSDIQLGYVTTFLDGSLALQANAAYQMNAGGARGEEAVTARAGAAIKF
jgi:hypothetical protein